METLETKQLLGYTLEIFEIGEFKEYYDEHTTQFNDFARNQFLKAISIPPAYFLEQPAETQEELLCNKLELVKVQKKYQGLSIIVVSQGNEILNATKIKTNEVEVQYESISSIEEVENIVEVNREYDRNIKDNINSLKDTARSSEEVIKDLITGLEET